MLKMLLFMLKRIQPEHTLPWTCVKNTHTWTSGINQNVLSSFLLRAVEMIPKIFKKIGSERIFCANLSKYLKKNSFSLFHFDFVCVECGRIILWQRPSINVTRLSRSSVHSRYWVYHRYKKGTYLSIVLSLSLKKRSIDLFFRYFLLFQTNSFFFPKGKRKNQSIESKTQARSVWLD